MSVEDVPPHAVGHLSTVLRIDPAAHGPLRVVVLISGGGSNLAALIEAAKEPDYGVQIVAVGSDRPGAGGVDIASSAGIPTFVERLQDHPDRQDWDRALTTRVAAHTPDLVVSAGFLKLVGPGFLAQFSGRYLNTHNALLPSFPGIHGPREALEYGVRITGATLFFVDEGVDTGPILAQVAVPVENDDTEESLTERIKQAERRQLVEQVGRLAQFGWTIQDRKVTAGMSDGDTSSAGTPSKRAAEEPAAGESDGSTADRASTARLLSGTAKGPLPSAGDDRSGIGSVVPQKDWLTDSEPREVAPEATEDGRRPLRRALLSVSDKSGLVELARALAAGGVALVSTGNSARTIADAGIEVTPVEQVTGAAEFLDGRVKTLHPAIHGGLLADTRNPAHLEQLAERGIDAFDLVVSNLYPFRQTLASGAAQDAVIEQIDIGGPAMIRASAKNHASVAVVVEPADYGLAVDALNAGGFTFAERQTLAAKAFAHTASYDVAVASWLNGVTTPADGWPLWTGATWQRQSVLRYGENPHQQAALYRHWRSGLAGAKQLHGKEMSYNNYVDVDAAWRAAADFGDPAAAIIKHSNPCGIAIVANGGNADIAQAHALALACDPVSAFGGVVAVNRTVTTKMAEQVAEVFTEVLLAPEFEEGALAVLTRKKNIRLLVMPADSQPDPAEFRAISGGILAQARDNVDAPGDDSGTWTLAAGNPADAQTLADLTFAWRACRSVKSNAILLAAGGASVGIGMGQVNRVDSAMLAVQRAGSRAAGAVAASDAFFPFADGLEILLRAGVRAVVQPGGSVRDAEVIAAAEAAGATLYLTGTRHFFH